MSTKPKTKTIVVHGSHGDVEITEDGMPVGELPAGYKNIRAFDLSEYRTVYPKEQHPSDIDILDVGYWYAGADGSKKYEPPEPDFRSEVARG